MGVFINTLPLRVTVDEESPLAPWLRDVQARLVAMRRFDATPPLKLHEWSDVPRGRPLFESLVIVQNIPFDPGLLGAGPFEIEAARVRDQTSYPLTMAAVPDERLALRAGYDARRFAGADVARMLGHFQKLLREIARAPDRRIAELSMVSASEHELLLGRWSGVGADGPPSSDRPGPGDGNGSPGRALGTRGDATR